ncbi:reverse transcriptase [Phytophthora megakarya]|uniref:Reverse transcriptase n=1 Tax=Phytophthora megakarya TaxID=4795 RepID=A0A225UZ65_9STRA|nr:reverse transcriptase [Phytophthora megakarya]
MKAAYVHDADAKRLIEFLSAPSDKARRKLAPRLRASAHRYRVHDGLLLYNDNAERIVVPNDPDLRGRIMYEYHDVLTEGHPGHEKTYSLLTRDFYWNHQYKRVRRYVRTCDVCQRVKPAPHSQAPLQPLPTPSECWESVSMDFVFGLPRDSRRKTAEVTSVQTARLFVDMVFKHHGMPNDFVSDRDPRFTARFWQEVFTLLGTQFLMSTADHPQTDGQTEHVKRVLVDLLKSYAQSFHNWSDYLPMAEFAINNAVHASTGHTPFFVNAMRHPRLPSTLGAVASSLSGGDLRLHANNRRVQLIRIYPLRRHVRVREPAHDKATCQCRALTLPVARASDVSMPGIDTEKLHAQDGLVAITHEVSVSDTDTTKSHAQSGTDANTRGESVQGADADKTNELDPGFSSQAIDIVKEQQAVVRFVQDAIAASADRQKLNADNFCYLRKTCLLIGLFTVTERHGSAYTLELPSDMRLHPTFYVGRLKPYVQPESSSRDDSLTTTSGASSASPQASSPSPEEGELVPTPQHRCLWWSERLRPRRPSARSAATSAQRSEKPERTQEPPRERGAPVNRGQPGVDHMMSVQHRRQKHNSVRGTIHLAVDRIVDHTSPKTNRGPVRFRIRWRQSGFLRDTWFHRNVLMTDVPEMVKAYEAHHGLEA